MTDPEVFVDMACFTGVFKFHDKISYCKNGNLHREDGPAIEYANGQKVWYIRGKEIKFSDLIDHLVSDKDIFIGIENGYAKFLNSDEVTEIYCGFFIEEMEKEIKKIEKLKRVLELLQTKETK